MISRSITRLTPASLRALRNSVASPFPPARPVVPYGYLRLLPRQFTATMGSLPQLSSALPNLPVFEAISRHDPESTAVVHSNSGRRFKYGELLGDVRKTRDRLHEAAGRSDINGERIAFLVENSYDYVGKPSRALAQFNHLSHQSFSRPRTGGSGWERRC